MLRTEFRQLDTDMLSTTRALQSGFTAQPCGRLGTSHSSADAAGSPGHRSAGLTAPSLFRVASSTQWEAVRPRVYGLVAAICLVLNSLPLSARTTVLRLIHHLLKGTLAASSCGNYEDSCCKHFHFWVN